MSLVNEWIETAQSVITEPVDFFSRETRRDGFGYPLKFAAVSIVLSAILSTVATAVNSIISTGLNPVGLVSTLFGTLIGGLLGLFIGAALIHLVVYLFGGSSGYKSTLAVLAYATAISPLSAAVSIIPILGGLISLILGIYAIYIQIKGVEEFQDLSTGQAAVSVLLPVVIITVIAIIFVVATVMFLSAGSLAGFEAAQPTTPVQ